MTLITHYMKLSGGCDRKELLNLRRVEKTILFSAMRIEKTILFDLQCIEKSILLM